MIAPQFYGMIQNLLEKIYNDCFSYAKSYGLDDNQASDMAFENVMKEVDSFAESMGHHSRNGSPSIKSNINTISRWSM